MSPNTQTVIIGYSLAAIAGAVVQIIQFKIKHKVDLDITYQSSANKQNNQLLEQLWTYAWPFSIWGLFTWFEEVAEMVAPDILRARRGWLLQLASN